MKKRNPLDDIIDLLEEYEEGCPPRDLSSSGEWVAAKVSERRAADVLIVQTMKITTPTEIEQYVLTPQIRRELAVALVKRGYTQKDVADMLRVSTATVTHYVKGQRAATQFAISGIEAAAEEIVNDPSRVYVVLASLLQQSKRHGTLCHAYETLTVVPENERPCVACKKERLCYDWSW